MNVKIELDKPRTLRFDIFAIDDLETDLGGKPLGRVVNDLAQLGIGTLVLCLLHGLKHEDPSLTRNLVKKILQSGLNDQRFTVDVVLNKVKLALDDSNLFRTADDTPGNVQAEAAVEH